MSYKIKKDLNLIPEPLRYDYVKDMLIKIAFFVIVLTLCFILFDYLYLGYKNVKVEKEIIKLNNYNHSLKQEIISVASFEKEYNQLEKKLKTTIEIKDELKSFYAIHHSALISSVIALVSKPNDIYFEKISYENGHITIDGIAKTSETFYRYYKALESNNQIKKVSFKYLKKDDPFYSFKIAMEIKKADELN